MEEELAAVKKQLEEQRAKVEQLTLANGQHRQREAGVDSMLQENKSLKEEVVERDRREEALKKELEAASAHPAPAAAPAMAAPGPRTKE